MLWGIYHITEYQYQELGNAVCEIFSNNPKFACFQYIIKYKTIKNPTFLPSLLVKWEKKDYYLIINTTVTTELTLQAQTIALALHLSEVSDRKIMRR